MGTSDAKLSPILFQETKSTSPAKDKLISTVDASSSPPQFITQSASTSPPQKGELEPGKSTVATPTDVPEQGPGQTEPLGFDLELENETVQNGCDLKSELDLNLEMKLKVSENIPWYAAIFGGIPALAGSIVFENIFDESLDDVSTFKFDVKGSLENPEIIRLN